MTAPDEPRPCVLPRTVGGDSEAEVRERVRQAQAEGWVLLTGPSRLYVGGKPAEGRMSWVAHMAKRAG